MRPITRGQRFLLAPNAFKGSLTSVQAARAMAIGVCRAGGTAALLPVADGGNGTLDVIRKPLGLVVQRTRALDPLGHRISVRWGYNPKTRWALIEMAKISGLALIKREKCRCPMKTTSFGTGQAILAAIRMGAKVVFLGLGGSATVDGGLGILQALGARVTICKLGKRQTLVHPATGKDLSLLCKIDSEPVYETLRGVRLRVLCDVRNPLTGPRGAARAFGPQKGATPSEVIRLERGLKRLAGLAKAAGKEISKIPGTGAAGGAAAGLLGFANARLERGAETVFRLIGLGKQIKQADVVVTGEGRVDRASWEGKGLGALYRLCRRYKKPLIVLAGGVDPGGHRRGVRLFTLGHGKMSSTEKMRNAKKLIQETAEKAFGFA